MHWPEVVELRDVTITPLIGGNSKSNMTFAADPPSPLLGHFRYGDPNSFVNILPLSPNTMDADCIVDPVIYGGPLFRHFGHALSESIHRLWPRFALKELAAARVAFTPINNTKVMPYVIEALNLHGISRHQVIRIDQPMRFRRLFVGPQGRQMAGPTAIPRYRTMLDSSLDIRLGPAGGERLLYLSRMLHHHTGSFYGESFVEAALAAKGFEIIYPEHHSLTELVAMLRASRAAVFAEGSAIHALELCGSATPAVMVIGRRPESIQRFTPLLSNICRKWQVSDRLLFNAGMPADRKKHSGVLDLKAVLKDVWGFAGLAGSPDTDGLVNAVWHDLEEHIADERFERTPDYETKAEELRQLLRSPRSKAA